MAQKKKSRATSKQDAHHQEMLLYIYSLIVIALSLIGLLEVGIVGIFLTNIITFLVGNLYGVVYASFIVLSILMIKDKSLDVLHSKHWIGMSCMFGAWLMLCALPQDETFIGMDVFSEYMSNASGIMNGTIACQGGILGALLYSVSSLLFDRMGTYIVIALIFILGLLLLVNKSLIDKVKDFLWIKGEGNKQKREQRKVEKQYRKEEKAAAKAAAKEEKQQQLSFIDYDDEEIEEEKVVVEEKVEKKPLSKFMHVNDVLGEEEDLVSSTPFVEETLSMQTGEVLVATPKETTVVNETSKYMVDFKNYKLPSLRLLQLSKPKGKSNVNSMNANQAGKRLVEILAQFSVPVTLVDTHIGPSVTKFELRPENGVRVNKISNLQQDIKMGLAAQDIRIEAPIPGKSSVGIEIPNQEKTMVTMRDLMKNISDDEVEEKLLFTLGKDLMGQGVYGKLNKLPHLLIAGSTGSGKSVCVNTIICSVLMRAKPDEVKMLLIDPKKVEFTSYAQIPHLMAPVITNAEEANRALKVVVKMMDDRYDLFAKAGVRNIAGFNEYIKSHPEETIKPLPFIMVVIDELADLMLVASKEVEASIQRITQLARAAGIHLIVATQRPSVDVITGIIKSNIPSRIAFAVSSAIDSRTILDQQGAEKLLGNGDMLYLPTGTQVATRLQGCFMSDEEVEAITKACSSQCLPRYEDVFLRLDQVDSQGGNLSDSSDPLYEEVKQFVIETQKASTSFVQRKFSVGYARAARLVDMLEADGIIGPSRGSKPREVLVKNEE